MTEMTGRTSFITPRRFRRLCLVLFIPLTLIGIVYMTITNPDQKYRYLLCDQDWCRYVGSSPGRLYKSAKADHEYWFDVTLDETINTFLTTNFVESKGIYLKDAIVGDASTSVSLETDPKASERIVAALKGRKVDIALGVTEKFPLFDDKPLLSCNHLSGSVFKDTLVAGCYGQDWSGSIQFEPSPEDATRLKKITKIMSDEVAEQDRDQLAYILIGYPIFFWLFLIISLITWIGFKATAYVRRG